MIRGYDTSQLFREDTFTLEKIEEIEALIIERNDARKDKNFARADEIRDIFIKQSILLEDSADGTTWRRN